MSTHYQAGKYRCQIVEQAFSESKEKKTPFFGIKVKPTGFYDVTTGDLVGCSDFDRQVQMYLTDNTVEHVIRNLRTLGFTGDSFKLLDPEMPGHHSLVGTEADFVCKHEPYDGGIGEKWELHFIGESRPLEKVSGLSKKLDALFGKQMKGSAGPKAAPARAADAGGVPVGAGMVSSDGVQPNDEIPF
jgi:hypothetical protein